MKSFYWVATAAVLAGALAVATPRAQSVDERVAQAAKPLPEALRAGATVVTYDSATGVRTVPISSSASR